ncbi:DNA endonuclease SmrA [Acerihabitans arboris]|uniref:DNA endonuclease SmrA n=1 Tax=Acerihabitans arboris TaxID=2691583 RepID=A0A845SHC9_9GAMM|nr:DNA endonuclease SmrA [Acerihabitans arboris]NDL62344.1 DNA endonuclease SmrA [Acerihabitans arboris]
MTWNDKELFKKAMDDVKPLKDPAKAVFLQHKSARTFRRTEDIAVADNFLITALHDAIPLDLPLCYKRDGIQQGVLDKLRGGRYPIEATLNLTRAPVETCRRDLFAFMQRLSRESVRTVLIIHGKGRNNDSHANIVRSFVARWLAQFDQVQAFCSAQTFHGGGGACYVALKKSAIARDENRERLARRGR